MSTLTSPTLGTLITSVRDMLGQPTATNSNWTDQELTRYINEAVRIYFAEVVIHFEGYFTVSTDPNAGGLGNYGNGNLSYTGGNELVPLPADCFQVRAVYIKRNQGWSMLPYINDLTHGYWTSSGNGDPNVYQPYYCFQGNNLALKPMPNISALNALKVDYIQMPDQLLNGGDLMTSQVSPVFKQLIEMYAVYKAKLKQSMVNGTDLTALAKDNLKEIYGNFRNTITPRSAHPVYTDAFNPEAY
jgi:hypothetical protein